MAGFIIAEFFIVGMLVTAVLVLNISCTGRLTTLNVIALRVGFSIYAGWLTAATILGVCIAQKTAGLNEKETSIDES